MSRRGQDSPDEGLEPGVLGRPTRADEHRRELIARLPRQLVHVLDEPLGPLGLVGAAGPSARQARDSRTAELLQDFAQSSRYELPAWDFGR